MSIFRWTAPLFKIWGRRWSEEDFRLLAGWLRPCVRPGGIIVDLGGGTGALGAGIARELEARAVIVDPTPQMLQRVDPLPWVSVRLARAESLPFPDGYCDALLCSDAFHHFRDQEAAGHEISRVVRTGGRVLVLDLDPKGVARLWVGLERLLREPAHFRTPQDMERFMAGHGICGTSRRQKGSAYSFLGTVV